MLRPLNLWKRLGLLMLALAFAGAAQARPAEAQAAKPPAQAASKAQAKRRAQARAKARPAAPKPAVKPAPAKPAAKKQAARKPAAKPAETAKKEEEEAPAPAAEHRRDPFLALISGAGGHGPLVLPPGKAGLQVSTVRVDGIVRSANGMIVVATSPQNRTYFLHQGDRLFDGSIKSISMDAVTFEESGKDPFGKPIERTVVKRVYPSAGEQQ